MIKLIYLFRRRRGMSREEFVRYWTEVHAPIGARIPGLRRLVQNLPDPADAGEGTYDGAAELWFDDRASLEAARRSLEWAASTRDEAHFIDPRSTALLVCSEREVLPEVIPEGPEAAS